ncbi:MAG: toll/interleukin-1 receptor domain-containing protein [Halobacteriota archaeon]
MAHEVFINYASADKSVADAACTTLEAHGIRCWIAPRDLALGEDDTKSILAAIDNSDVIVLFLSSAANASRLVTQQAAHAFTKNIPIVSLRVEDVEPSNALKLFLGSQGPIDAYPPPLDAHLQRLEDSVAALINKPKQKQEAARDISLASLTDAELEWIEPWDDVNREPERETAFPERRGRRPARQQERAYRKRSAVPALLAISVLAIIAVGVVALASDMLPFDLGLNVFKQQAKRLLPEQTVTPIPSPVPLSGEGELRFFVQTSKAGNEVQPGDTIDITFHKDGSFIAPFTTHGTTKSWPGTYSFSTDKDLKLTGSDNIAVLVTLKTDGTFSWMRQGDSSHSCTGQYTWVQSFR